MIGKCVVLSHFTFVLTLSTKSVTAESSMTNGPLKSGSSILNSKINIQLIIIIIDRLLKYN